MEYCIEQTDSSSFDEWFRGFVCATIKDQKSELSWESHKHKCYVGGDKQEIYQIKIFMVFWVESQKLCQISCVDSLAKSLNTSFL